MATIHWISRLLIAFLIALALAAQVPVIAASTDSELGPNEVKVGKEAADEVKKEYKLSDNAADLKRVREIGNKLAAVANKKMIDAMYGSSKVTPFEYTFDIIEDKDVNAFCVPGGHVYVYRGLLNFVQSDQELAGVIAHEVTHAAHHHMVYLLKKQAALQNEMAVALLATMLSGAKGSDIDNVLLGTQLYTIAKSNGYGMQAERDADNSAVLLDVEAGYNPVGLLTFLERLAQQPELVDYGIYRSHPLDEDRVKAAKAAIEKLGLPINRRATTKSISAIVKTEKIDGVDQPEVSLADKVIYRPAPADGKTAQDRAQEVATAINNMLDSGLMISQLRADTANGAVIARDKAVMIVSDADAKLMNETPGQVAQAAAAIIRNVILMQMVDTVH